MAFGFAPAVRGWVCTFILCLVGLGGPWLTGAEAGPLPRARVSVPSGADAAAAAREWRAAAPEAALVLAPVVITVGSPLSATAEPVAIPAGVDAAALVDLRLPEAGAARPTERELVQQLTLDIGRLGLATTGVKTLIVRVGDRPVTDDLLAFAVATLAVQARVIQPTIRIDLALPADALLGQPEVGRRLAAYADAFSFSLADLTGPSSRLLMEAAAGRPVTARVDGAGRADDVLAHAFLEALAVNVTDLDSIWLEAPALAAVRPLGRMLSFLGQAVAGSFEASALERVPVAVGVAGRPASGVAFVTGDSPDLRFLIRTGASSEASREVTLTAGPGDVQELSCFDAVTGQSLSAAGGADRTACRSTSAWTWLSVRRNGEHRLTESVSVRGRAEMRVEEILARWQASREAERRSLTNFSVPALLTLHFEAGAFGGTNFDVSQQLLRMFDQQGTNDWVQQSLLVNGVRLKKGQAFPLPMLEPEKVMTQPLELSMTEKYTYRLLGTETLNGTPCFVVAIQPASDTEQLYAGKVWIDGLRFRQVRLQLEQRSASHNISSHIETQEFRTVKDAAGLEFTMLDRIFVQEALNVAGRPITLEKRFLFEDYTVNATDFGARVDAARADHPAMYRETDQGLRSLRQDGDALVVVENTGKKVKSLIAGTIYDGSVPYPTPLAGISWVDFDFRGSGSQLSAVFAGLFFAGNLSRKVGPNVHASLEAYVSALPLVDKVYDGNVEREGERFRSYDQWVGGVVNWQATPKLTISASSHLTYTIFAVENTTSPTFTLPSNVLTLRAWAEAKYVTQSFDANALVEPAVRLTGSGAFGSAASPSTLSTTSGRYEVELNKRVYAGRLTRGAVSASYYGGWDLDRLSRYHNSYLIKPRIVGLPAGADAFDAVGIASASYGFNVLDVAKLEGAWNHVWARNRDESTRFRQLDGLSVDLGLAGPLGTYVSAAGSVALSGAVERYPSRWGLSLLFFKPLGK